MFGNSLGKSSLEMNLSTNSSTKADKRVQIFFLITGVGVGTLENPCLNRGSAPNIDIASHYKQDSVD